MSDMAAIWAAGLVPIRQEWHIVHVNHQEVRRPAAFQLPAVDMVVF